MGGTYTEDEGKKLVRAARKAISGYLGSHKFDAAPIENGLHGFDDKRGMFVTVRHYPTGELRGSIGAVFPEVPVKKLLVNAAIAAATEDQRFVPMSHRELDDVVVEVDAVFDVQKLLISNGRVVDKIRIGEDGLTIKYGFSGATMLPFQALENGWDDEQFLDSLSAAAGLPKHYWRRHGVKICRFKTQRFEETSPNGEAEEVFPPIARESKKADSNANPVERLLKRRKDAGKGRKK